jgi:hypothetical protein
MVSVMCINRWTTCLTFLGLTLGDLYFAMFSFASD